MSEPISEPVGIGQGRKSRREMWADRLAEAHEKLARLGFGAVETKVNDYGRLVAISYRNGKRYETGIRFEDEAEHKILLMVERDPTPDKQIAYEESFIEQARAFRKEQADA